MSSAGSKPTVGRGGLGGGGGGGHAGRGGRGGGGGRGRGGWGKLRQAVRNDADGKGGRRRPNLLNTMKMTSFRFSQKHLVRGDTEVPEEGGDLHKHFRTCASLTRIREEFRSALSEDAERKLGFGMNACAIPEDNTGRLLMHSIGLNHALITSGGTTAAQSRVNQFVLQELLPAFPSAIVEEDDQGRIPFVEAIEQWITARRAVRKWKVDTDRTREKVALVAAKIQKKIGALAAKTEHHGSDSDSEDSSLCDMAAFKRRSKNSGSRFGTMLLGNQDQKLARMELKMIVESSDDSMFCIDEKGLILLTNDAAAKQFGYSKRELTGSNISIICNSKDAPNHHEYLERYLRTGEKRVMGKKRELLAKRKDDSTFYIELGLTEVNLGGGKFIFCGFVKDITQLKLHRRSLEYAQQSFNESHVSIHRDNEEKDEGGGSNKQALGVPPLVEWCLNILSEFVDNYGYGSTVQTGGADSDDESSLDASLDLKASFTNLRAHKEPSLVAIRDTIVVEKVAAIPHLLEELLLIKDPDARARVFDISLVHKVLFSTDSLGKGDWLIGMLDKSIRVQKQKVIDANLTGADVDTAEGRAIQLQLRMAQEECRFMAEAVVFYLEQVSELNMQDDLYVFHHVQMHQEVTQNGGMADMISTGDVHHFEKHRNELFDAVGALPGLIRRICVLEDDLVKRAATTPVIRRLLDKIMFSPFATISAMFDGINHFLLMISFRLGPAPAIFHLSRDDDTFQPQQYLFASATLVASLSYFGTKAIHAGLSKYALSENLFWSDMFSFWSLLETLPLLMVLFCSIAVDIVLRQRAYAEVADSEIPFFLRIVVAITTPFLWLRIMGFVKVRNKQLATFILCSVEIIKDIKWFLLVLFAAMASFAQMWVSFTFEPDQIENQHYMEGYLKAYTMMLGDLDADALRTHPMIAGLFVVYTFGVTVVLLNILIAIVSDSYQNSFVSSKMMLGKARVMFVSELLSVKTFHHMWMEGKTGTTRRNLNYIFGTVSVLHLWMITRTITGKLGQDLICDEDEISSNTVRFEAILAFSLLFVMLFTMKVTVAYVLNEFNDTGGLKTARMDPKSSSRLQRSVNWFVTHVFSALSTSFDSLFDREDNLHQLGGNRSATNEHRSDRAIQRSIDKTRKGLKSELRGMSDQLQLSLGEFEEKNKEQISKLEEHLSNAVRSTVAESHQLLLQAMQTRNSNGWQSQYSLSFAENCANSLTFAETVPEDGSAHSSTSSLSLDQVASSD